MSQRFSGAVEGEERKSQTTVELYKLLQKVATRRNHVLSSGAVQVYRSKQWKGRIKNLLLKESGNSYLKLEIVIAILLS